VKAEGTAERKPRLDPKTTRVRARDSRGPDGGPQKRSQKTGIVVAAAVLLIMTLLVLGSLLPPQENDGPMQIESRVVAAWEPPRAHTV